MNCSDVADESVNVFQTQAIGESSIQGMAGTSPFQYKFRKKGMVITMKTSPLSIFKIDW